MKQFHGIKRAVGCAGVYGGKGQVKTMCLQMFLEGSNWNGWADRQQEVVPKRQSTRVQSSCACTGLAPRDWQTNSVAWSQWTGWDWWYLYSKAAEKAQESSISRSVFICYFVIVSYHCRQLFHPGTWLDKPTRWSASWLLWEACRQRHYLQGEATYNEDAVHTCTVTKQLQYGQTVSIWSTWSNPPFSRASC